MEIFIPAIAIADEIKDVCQMHKFCSLEQKEEWKWEKVPKVGYDIKGLPISGI